MNDQSLVSTLQEIGARTRDSAEGYRTSAQDVHDYALKSHFESLARERSEMADEIDRLTRQYGGEPAARSGSTLGAVHRMFVDIRSALSRDDRQAVLQEVARGESAAEQAYDHALKQNLPEDVRAELRRQHDRVKQTRNRFAAMAGMDPRSTANSSTAAIANFVSERPMLSGTLMTFGLGILIGALFMSFGGGRSHAHHEARRPRRSAGGGYYRY